MTYPLEYLYTILYRFQSTILSKDVIFRLQKSVSENRSTSLGYVVKPNYIPG